LPWILDSHVLAVEGSDIQRFRLLSAPGLLVYALTVTFMSIDWAMSLEPEWFSTIYGILFMGGQGLSAMAFVISVLFLCALSVAGSIFLILEMDHPFDGLMKVSSAPIRYALTELGR